MTRDASGRAARTMPVWYVAKDAPKDIDLRIAGKTARHCEIDAAHPAPLHARAVLRLEPDIGLQSLFAPWTGVELGLDGAFLEGAAVLLRPADGVMVARRGSSHAIVHAREALLVTDLAHSALQLTRVSRVDCFIAPRDRLGEGAMTAAGAMSVFSASDDALQMLGNYGAALMRGLMPMKTPELREHVMAFMVNLVNIMAQELGQPAGAPPSHRPDDRMIAIKSDIEARLTDQGLNARQVAEQHGISLRYLQKLFSDEMLTFSDFVLQRRLERAMRMLQSREGDHLSISGIAFTVGFGDLSYFNRTFRRRFGVPPRQARSVGRAVQDASVEDAPISTARPRR
ncbi:transcriptional activator RhrA [Camelimonas fluminis]|uniref:Helix-turn-helix transcriptional regulator n=1 Tax=Camelimonas fluminis TaxID=1576911 RepID=A0ABV7ULP7_9HYPH|nr:helix-turn-helix domain-containing protein [Camelimonas fluminis]GHE75765.1 transcriptional activator RhrA [Camelimonas fluminis]